MNNGFNEMPKPDTPSKSTIEIEINRPLQQTANNSVIATLLMPPQLKTTKKPQLALLAKKSSKKQKLMYNAPQTQKLEHP